MTNISLDMLHSTRFIAYGVHPPSTGNKTIDMGHPADFFKVWILVPFLITP
jgi:hypothetical protein